LTDDESNFIEKLLGLMSFNYIWIQIFEFNKHILDYIIQTYYFQILDIKTINTHF